MPLDVHPHRTLGMETQQHQIAGVGQIELGWPGGQAGGGGGRQAGLAIGAGLQFQSGRILATQPAQQQPQRSASKQETVAIIGPPPPLQPDPLRRSQQTQQRWTLQGQFLLAAIDQPENRSCGGRRIKPPPGTLWSKGPGLKDHGCRRCGRIPFS